ncbi:peptide deformylase [Frigoribacterium sp. PvP120]|uniref:peptide deformylase n=1 Tax=unclassified Frigoribacterium TaxID=2627005 RepID=UPI001AE56A13|nr:peptide deformylase [Frigoribacterium sp. PvP121]MBP1242026.1 peptide deformylase [Frigoribacterium sp. PvP121]
MTVRTIRLFGDPVLRSPADPVVVGDPRLDSLVADLLDTVREPGRAGVAAPQIGVDLRAFSYNVDGEVGYVLNPVVVEASGERELVDEGCLSVPGFWFPTPRWSYARVEGVDLAGERVVLEGTGLMAQALQHETDHLAGTLYVMTLEPETKRDAMRQIRASDWWRV